MQPDGHVAFGKLFEDGQEFRIVKRAAIHVGINLNAGGSQLQNGAVDFLHCGRRIVHGQRGDESWKAVWILHNQFGQTIVGDLSQFR